MRISLLKVFLALIIVIIGYGWITNSFTPISVSFSPSQIPKDVERYIQDEEAQFKDIKPGLQKQIIWNNPETKNKTPYSIVYIHGFTASKEEIRPVPDDLAFQLNANLFYTRLTGHAQTYAALGEASYNDWVNDVAEAFEVGRRIGDKVIVMGTSLGGALTAWSVKSGQVLQKDIAAIILVSPAFQLEQTGTTLFTVPFAGLFIRATLGTIFCFNTKADMMELYQWTNCIAPQSLKTLGQFVLLSQEATTSRDPVSIPTLFIYDLKDKIANASFTTQIYGTWGPNTERLLIRQPANTQNHLIVGDLAKTPKNQIVIEEITSWLHKQENQVESDPDQ
ncbi:alpha/beta hydrolase [Flexibacterium corallicola]|uniref:alpha/beta hydrolase n=1 Tax=Flexibacterium corallicola TaxID=3037259 RepID=UPI00286F1E2C|nr:alpha/beta fold hydrolase [Pseudovibrio sp. M1P-2-3]